MKRNKYNSKKDERSNMNITFSIKNDQMSKIFDKLCLENNIHGIKGHRSVGGYRASLYNAMSIDNSVNYVKVMSEWKSLLFKNENY